MLGLIASLHLLAALAIFAATLWIGSRGMQQQQQPTQAAASTASVPPRQPEARPEPLRPIRSSLDAEPEWLRQAQARDLAPLPWQR